MGKNRPRYNERARASSNKQSRPHQNPRDGGRKSTKPTVLQPDDSNAEILIPGNVDTDAMEFNAEAVKPKMSSKKKKRLDKYIEKKLKKDARGDLFKKLEEQAWSSNLLKSSRTLGQNKETTKQKLKRALNEHRLGLEQSDKDVRLFKDGKDEYIGDYQDDDNDSDSEGDSGDSEDEPAANRMDVDMEPKPVAAVTKPTVSAGPIVTGSALKVGASILARKSATGKKPSRLAMIRAQKEAAKQKERESSFDSSNSEYDSSSDEDSEDKQGTKHSGSEDSGDDTGEPAKKKRRGWMTDLGGVASNAEGEEERIVSNMESLPERVEDFLPGRTGPQRDLLGNRVQKVGQLDEGDVNEAFHVHVDRDPEIQEMRLKLPVCTEEQHIMEHIIYNDIILIKGETGSGKTTQVPQFLYEAGYGNPNSPNPGMIGITQPRRVAAVSMADRVAKELNLPATKVSYQIRYDATTSPETVMKFMTDGVLLRELNSDFLLRKYSVIIIDEAHERSLNTDILIGALSRIVRLRREESRKDRENTKPLKLIIMSATLVIEEFTRNERLFGHVRRQKKANKGGEEKDAKESSDEDDESHEEKPAKDLVPVVSVDVKKSYGLTIHFNKRTPEVDYVTEAFKKIVKIHSRLPAGGILVFLSGQAEIMTLVKKLRKKFPFPDTTKQPAKFETKLDSMKKGQRGTNGSGTKSEDTEAKEDAPNNQVLDPRNEDVELEDMAIGESEAVAALEGMEEDDEAFDLDASDSEEELGEDDEVLEETPDAGTAPLHILPLYSLLKTEEQMKVFQPPPPGSRLCVIATNVAETSITIPDIKYVVDSGKSKERHYDKETGIQTFQVGWTSKASATQRAGRAGRTAHGHCYRLYSSAVYENEFSTATDAEILRMPIDGVVLQMKSMFIDNVVNFPFPTPPDREDLKQSEQRLVYLNALENSNKKGITELGKTMSIFPLIPRLAKMLTLAHQENCFQYIIAIVAALSVGDVFVKEFQLDVSRPGDSDDESDDDDRVPSGRGLNLDELDEIELQHIRNDKVLKKEQNRRLRQQFYKSQAVHEALDPMNDLAKILNVVGAYARETNKEKFCTENFVRFKAMQEIHQLRGQLTRMVQDNFANSPTVSSLVFDPYMEKPTPRQLTAIRQIVACAFLDQIAIRKDLLGAAEENYSKKAKSVPYVTMWSKESVYIHPSSGLFGCNREKAPAMIVYQDLQRTIKAVEIESKPSKIYLRGLTTIDPKWMATLANGTGLVRASKERIIKIDDKTQKAMTDITFGPQYWPLPAIELWQRREGARLVPMTKAEVTAKKLQISRKANR
ncbi:P-loop containing nucleoside triphosphate hydrolase protein [Mortierella sp. GBAus27b]|nr:putative ATP-dependent RNA helicase DHR1 [Mortierella sp. GBA43]KAI8350765.1 P-loop containing nucleoside triphosphate hydrolase protein [Mortierella sp. GBAus27b]